MPAEPFPGYAALRDRVEAGLRRALALPGEESRPFVGVGPGCPDRLRAAMRHSLLAGGKRLRPVLTLVCHDVCGTVAEPAGEPAVRQFLDGGPSPVPVSGDDNALRAAVAVEMVHTYSLVHDDLPCMDDDDLRRGRPTCHVAFDEATAVLAGDALLTQALLEVGTLYPPQTALFCVGTLATAAGASGMVGGQTADLLAESGDGTPGTGEELEAIHRRKTGALFAAACELGAYTAGCSAMERSPADDLREYGRSLGLAFQIADDLLDLSQPAEVLGKTAGKDAAAGKLTYPALYGEAGSRARAAELVNAALAAVEPLGEAADPLRALARYAVERDR